MCCFRSALQKEFHLDACELDHVMIPEGVRRGADLRPVDGGTARTLDVGDEIALWPARQHGDLHARLTEGGEWLGELKLLAGIGAGEQLDRPQRLPRPGCRGGDAPGACAAGLDLASLSAMLVAAALAAAC